MVLSLNATIQVPVLFSSCTAAGSDKVKVKDQQIKEEISLMEEQCEQAAATAK